MKATVNVLFAMEMVMAIFLVVSVGAEKVNVTIVVEAEIAQPVAAAVQSTIKFQFWNIMAKY